MNGHHYLASDDNARRLGAHLEGPGMCGTQPRRSSSKAYHISRELFAQHPFEKAVRGNLITFPLIIPGKVIDEPKHMVAFLHDERTLARRALRFRLERASLRVRVVGIDHVVCPIGDKIQCELFEVP
jgi:hypothetical protein